VAFRFIIKRLLPHGGKWDYMLFVARVGVLLLLFNDHHIVDHALCSSCF
jgi:hypothetical protein